jgi:Mor family transcriptional regulator
MSRKIQINWEDVKSLIDEGYTRNELKDHFNVSLSKIKRLFRENDFSFGDAGTDWRTILIDNHDIVMDIYNKRSTAKDVSDYFGCSYSRVTDYFKSIGIEYRQHNKINEADIENIIFQYNSGISGEDLGIIYNCSGWQIRNILRKNNIKIRDRKDLLLKRNSLEEFQKKCIDGSWKNKDYVLPSGKSIKLRGYEPQFLDFVFKNNIVSENEIDYSPSRIPYTFNNKQYHYYPDFYIPNINLILEIKSSWILKKQGLRKNKAKEQGSIDSGFDYLLLLDNDYEPIRKYYKY